jgi:hypothetical protein
VVRILDPAFDFEVDFEVESPMAVQLVDSGVDFEVESPMAVQLVDFGVDFEVDLAMAVYLVAELVVLWCPHSWEEERQCSAAKQT